MTPFSSNVRIPSKLFSTTLRIRQASRQSAPFPTIISGDLGPSDLVVFDLQVDSSETVAISVEGQNSSSVSVRFDGFRVFEGDVFDVDGDGDFQEAIRVNDQIGVNGSSNGIGNVNMAVGVPVAQGFSSPVYVVWEDRGGSIGNSADVQIRFDRSLDGGRSFIGFDGGGSDIVIPPDPARVSPLNRPGASSSVNGFDDQNDRIYSIAAQPGEVRTPGVGAVQLGIADVDFVQRYLLDRVGQLGGLTHRLVLQSFTASGAGGERESTTSETLATAAERTRHRHQQRAPQQQNTPATLYVHTLTVAATRRW